MASTKQNPQKLKKKDEYFWDEAILAYFSFI